MRTVSIFKNGHNQAIRLPKEFQFKSISELEILKQGDTVILRPVKHSWSSFKGEPTIFSLSGLMLSKQDGWSCEKSL